MRSWTTSGLPVARCKVTKKSSGVARLGEGFRPTRYSFPSLITSSPSSTNPAMPLQGFARTCVPRRREIAAYTTARNLAGSRRSYSLEAPPSCELNSSAASVNFSRGQPQFQEGANRGSTARHSSHKSPVINLPQLLWREHNLEPLSTRH